MCKCHRGSALPQQGLALQCAQAYGRRIAGRVQAHLGCWVSHESNADMIVGAANRWRACGTHVLGGLQQGEATHLTQLLLVDKAQGAAFGGRQGTRLDVVALAQQVVCGVTNSSQQQATV